MSDELKPILKAMRHAYYQGGEDSWAAFYREDAELDELFSVIAEECLMEIKEKGKGEIAEMKKAIVKIGYQHYAMSLEEVAALLVLIGEAQAVVPLWVDNERVWVHEKNKELEIETCDGSSILEAAPISEPAPDSPSDEPKMEIELME